MTTTPYDQPRRGRLAGWLPFIRHYIEMVLAMVIGMYALMPLWQVAFRAVGAPHLLDHAEPMALSMATGMGIGMGAWMAFRRHGWRDIAEMTAAMYLPFVILFPATLAGAMTSGLILVSGASEGILPGASPTAPNLGSGVQLVVSSGTVVSGLTVSGRYQDTVQYGGVASDLAAGPRLRTLVRLPRRRDQPVRARAVSRQPQRPPAAHDR